MKQSLDPVVFVSPKASCDQGISAMEEMYRRLVEDLGEQHHREVAELLKEKEELLEEETKATMAGKQRSF